MKRQDVLDANTLSNELWWVWLHACHGIQSAMMVFSLVWRVILCLSVIQLQILRWIGCFLNWLQRFKFVAQEIAEFLANTIVNRVAFCYRQTRIIFSHLYTIYNCKCIFGLSSTWIHTHINININIISTIVVVVVSVSKIIVGSCRFCRMLCAYFLIFIITEKLLDERSQIASHHKKIIMIILIRCTI